MRFLYYPFFAFAALFVLTVFNSSDPTTYMYFGSATLTLLPDFVVRLIVSFVLVLVTFGYWLISKRLGDAKRSVFLAHLFLTIPAVLFVRFSSFISSNMLANEYTSESQLTLLRNCMIVVYILFALGQVLFAVYFFRMISSKRENE